MTAKTEKKPAVFSTADVIKDMDSVINNGKATPAQVSVAKSVKKHAEKDVALETITKSIKEVASSVAIKEPLKETVKKIEKAATEVKDALDKGKVIVTMRAGNTNDIATASFKQRYTYENPNLPDKSLEGIEISQVTAENVTMTDFNKMDSGIVVMGCLLAPVSKETVVRNQNYRGDRPDYDLTAFNDLYENRVYIPQVEFFSKEQYIKFNTYRFTLNGHFHQIHIMGDTKMWFGDIKPNNLDWNLREKGVNVDKNAVVYAKDAVLIDCGLSGINSLVNVNLTKCTANNSSIVYELPSDEMTRLKHYHGKRYLWHKGTNKEIQGDIKDSDFHESNIANSDLPVGGTYYKTHIADSVIENSNNLRTTLYGADIRESTIKAGGNIFVGTSNIKRSFLSTKGNLLFAAPKLEEQSIRGKNIMVKNKLNFSVFEVPDGRYESVQMLRTDEKTIELCGFTNEPLEIQISDDHWGIRMNVVNWLKKEPLASYGRFISEAPVNTDGMVKGSITDYLADTIMSRLKVIILVDESTALVKANQDPNLDSHYQGPNF